MVSVQEDAHVAILNFDGHPDRALFGVFDGHSGAAVAKFCAKYFPNLLLASEEYKAGDYAAAFNSIYLQMDEMLQKPEHAEELQRMDEKKRIGAFHNEESDTFHFVEPGVVFLPVHPSCQNAQLACFRACHHVCQLAQTHERVMRWILLEQGANRLILPSI
jgi:Protein phosphatase 2C